MTDLNQLSETELQSLLENAGRALKERQYSKRKEVIAQIKDLAASIGVNVEIQETGKKLDRRSAAVPSRYRNPNDATQTWTGRGLKPKWMKALIDAGHSASEFEIQ